MSHAAKLAPSRPSRPSYIRNEVSFLSKLAIVLSLTVCALSAQTNASRVSGPARFDLTAIDKSVDPCVDFYHYACGTWIKNNPIPPDQAMWGRFNELADRNRDILHEILEAVRQTRRGPRCHHAENRRLLRGLHGRKGHRRQRPGAARTGAGRIRNLNDKAQLADEIARLHSIGVECAVSILFGQDFQDSNDVIAQFDQGGLGLPDRDYYLKDDPKSVELRQKYVAHVARMMELAARSPTRRRPMPTPS
jgi:putative endopeptidase